MLNLDARPRILITRLSAIGDCVHTLPLVSAIRARFPKAFVGWATQAAGGKIVEGTDGLDELVVVRRDWLKSFAGIRRIRAELRSHRYDVVVDPQSLTKSSLLGWLSGAKQRIGFARGQGRELGPWLSTINVEPQGGHVVDRYLELLKPLGVRDPKVVFNVPRQTSATESMQRYLQDHGLTRFALLNPGAGWNSKIWPHDRYADVASHLYSTARIKSVVLWAGNRERAWAEEIVATAEGASIIASSTSLAQLASLCRLSDLFVGSDTGPMHLAAAVGTPCVAMYGPTKISVCGPYGLGHEPLQARFQGGTSKQRRGDDNSAMCEIDVPTVTAACDRIVGRSSSSRVA